MRYSFQAHFKQLNGKAGALVIKVRLERHNGIVMNHKKIRRLMRQFGLVATLRQANPYRKMAKATRPKGWEIPVSTVNFHPGGVWHYCMKCIDQNQGQFFGMESWGKGVYKEIIEPEKIVYTDYFSDAEGNLNDSMPSTEITLEFIDLGGKTKLINRAEYVSEEALKTVMDMGMVQGITETWDRLNELVELLK